MTMLPTWIDRSYGLDYEKNKLKEALAIAWEALDKVGFRAIKWENALTMEMQATLKEAMRRIEELGKETV